MRNLTHLPVPLNGFHPALLPLIFTASETQDSTFQNSAFLLLTKLLFREFSILAMTFKVKQSVFPFNLQLFRLGAPGDLNRVKAVEQLTRTIMIK